MNIQFRRPEVAAKYEATTNEDITLHTGCYTGKLSGINICGADHLFATKHPAIKLKESVANTGTPGAED
jgi:hypothetical protein